MDYVFVPKKFMGLRHLHRFFIGTLLVLLGLGSGPMACRIVRADCALHDPSCRPEYAAFLAASFLATTTSAALPVEDGATLWLDAGNGLEPPLWRDQSANRFVLAGPMVVESNFINGRAAARCGTAGLNGGMSMLLNDASSLASTNAGTIFAVFRTTGPNSTLFLWQHSSLGPAYRFGLFTAFGDQIFFEFGDIAGNTGRVVGSQPAGFDNAWHIMEAFRDGSTGEIHFGGTALILDVSSSFTTDLVLTEPASLLVCSEGSGGVDFAGDLAELIVFNRALSDSERNSMRCYLEQKYALSGGCV